MPEFRSTFEPSLRAIELAIPIMIKKKQHEQELALKHRELSARQERLKMEDKAKQAEIVREANKAKFEFIGEMHKNAVEEGNQSVADQTGPLLEKGYGGFKLPNLGQAVPLPNPGESETMRNFPVAPLEREGRYGKPYVGDLGNLLQEGPGGKVSKVAGAAPVSKKEGLTLGSDKTPPPGTPPPGSSPDFEVTPEDALTGIGPGAKIKEKINNVIGWMYKGKIPFAKASEARNTLRLFRKSVEVGLINNPRFPVAERTAVEGIIGADPNKFWRDPDEGVKNLEKLKVFLETKVTQKGKAVEAGNITEGQAKEYLTQINDINSILSMMGKVGADPSKEIDLSNLSEAELDAIIEAGQ